MTLLELMELREKAQNLFYFITIPRRSRKLLWLIMKAKYNKKNLAVKRVRHNGKYKFFANKI
jgi:hypothetical protein